MKNREKVWPELPLHVWRDTYQTLHLWTQIVGKVLLKLRPLENHWWEVAFRVSPRGLTSLAIPYGNGSFEISFDFIDHTLSILTSDGEHRALALAPKSVSDFYCEFMDLLNSLGIFVKIDATPSEIPNPIPFDKDQIHFSYDREYANRFWRILVHSDRVMEKFKGCYMGKSSPVHFFWGSFDLAVSRFSGRRAPDRSKADSIIREAYSHEVSSCGFWPGSGNAPSNIDGAAYYAYFAPEPKGYSEGKIKPAPSFYNAPTKGYVLMYDEVRLSPDPERLIMEFFQSTYEWGAELGHWDRMSLEREFPKKTAAA